MSVSVVAAFSRGRNDTGPQPPRCYATSWLHVGLRRWRMAVSEHPTFHPNPSFGLSSCGGDFYYKEAGRLRSCPLTTSNAPSQLSQRVREMLWPLMVISGCPRADRKCTGLLIFHLRVQWSSEGAHEHCNGRLRVQKSTAMVV
jgi:hypothetical protein